MVLVRLASRVFPVFAVVALLATTLQPARSAEWNEGDLIVGSATEGVNYNSHYVYDRNGTLKDTLPAGAHTMYCAFNPDKTKIYFSDWRAERLVVTDVEHPHNVSHFIDLSEPVDTFAVSMVFNSAGDFYISTRGSDKIPFFDNQDNFVEDIDASLDNRRNFHLDLAADEQTLWIATRDGYIFSYDMATNQTQLFARSDQAFLGLKLLPPFDGSGGLLVANRFDAKRYDADGNVAQTYSEYMATNETYLYTLALDIDGTSFWTSNIRTGNYYKFDIESGSILNSFSALPSCYGFCILGAPSGISSLAVRSGVPSATPSSQPTKAPLRSGLPSAAPSSQPAIMAPSPTPTQSPSKDVSAVPSSQPAMVPSPMPTQSTMDPSPTPTQSPSNDVFPFLCRIFPFLRFCA